MKETLAYITIIAISPVIFVAALGTALFSIIKFMIKEYPRMAFNFMVNS